MVIRRKKLDNAVFIDTWGWMALGHRVEPRHTEVKRIYQELRSNQILIYTSDYVLDELTILLFRRENFEEAVRFVEGIFAASALGQVRIERVTPDRFVAVGFEKAISGQARYFVHGSHLDVDNERAEHRSGVDGRRAFRSSRYGIFQASVALRAVFITLPQYSSISPADVWA